MIFYQSEHDKVTKYIHSNGAETIIKSSSNCNNFYNKENNKIEVNSNINSHKYSIFMSCSIGCLIKCKFCYLTNNKINYIKLNQNDYFNNLKEAINNEIILHPEYKEKYVTLSWMGMGEPLLYSKSITNISIKLMNILKNYSIGFESIDFATTFPRIYNYSFNRQNEFTELNEILNICDRNKNTTKKPLRIFYSLHSVIDKTRNILIPKSYHYMDALDKLMEFKEINNCDIILHHMFLDNINDSDEEIEKLVDLVENQLNKQCELRILRFNSNKNSTYTESKKIYEIIKYLNSNVSRIKYQISSGYDINSSCGMFNTK